MKGLNIGKMMKMASQAQKTMKSSAKKLNSEKFVGKSPEDIVEVTFTGDRKMQGIKIQKKAIDPNDPDTLEDLIVSAVNDANKQIVKATRQSLGKYTKGIPGL